MNHPVRSNSGFTLVELLVVISIIMLLAGFGVTKYISVSRDAELAASQENLRQVHAQLMRYENKKRRLPKASGSEFVMAIWGLPGFEKSVNSSKIMFCPSLAAPDLTEDNLDEEISAETIHWAGLNQAEKRFRMGRMKGKNATKKIIVCNKPLVNGEMPHAGDYLAVLFADGNTRSIGRDEYPSDWSEDEILEIGEQSPVDALQALSYSSDDDY